MQVKGLRAETIQAILHSREERGAFRSLEDFLARVPVERDEIKSLIKCGALDEFGETRPALLWRLNLARARGTALQAQTPTQALDLLFPAAERGPGDACAASVALPRADYTREQRLAYEQEILEVCVSGHPLDLVERNGEVWSTELDAHRGRRIALLGWLITFRHVGTKDYRNMMFATFEDQRGVYEAVLFPEAYARYRIGVRNADDARHRACRGRWADQLRRTRSGEEKQRLAVNDDLAVDGGLLRK
jgi:DNA polymerase III alpha subunit